MGRRSSGVISFKDGEGEGAFRSTLVLSSVYAGVDENVTFPKNVEGNPGADADPGRFFYK
jgi:hypothetical protein